jgi:quinol monooxygenase YgiN
MAKLAIFVTANAQPGKREELRKLFEKHIKPHVESNKAQELCFYCYDTQNENTMCMFELFNDPAVVKADMESEWFAAYQKDASAVLAGPPQVIIASPVWVKSESA